MLFDALVKAGPYCRISGGASCFPKAADLPPSLNCRHAPSTVDLLPIKLTRSKSEVSFLGGKAEETDANDAETTTQEAKEEIGVDPSLVNVVTCVEPFLSKHLLRVIPVIGILSNNKDFIPSPNAAEVEAVFDAPLEMFLKDENRKSEEREWMGDKYLIHFFYYEINHRKYLIWDLTTGVFISAASIVYQKPPAFLEQNPKFKVPRVVQKDTIMP
ncbi:Nudix hydrolase 15 [Abeliophyllum distichum]|uniref:Nudix hydrolase 15 n=1 Tax=Abeliophyllum distichum TaxID=126358 RepID=A0ABD1U334_9LAMI